MTENKKLTKEGGFAAQAPMFQQIPIGLAQTLYQPPVQAPTQVPTGNQHWSTQAGLGGLPAPSYTWSPTGGLQPQMPPQQAPNASQSATPTQPSPQVFNPFKYGTNTSEFDFLSDKGVPGRVMTIDQIMAALHSGKSPVTPASGTGPKKSTGPKTPGTINRADGGPMRQPAGQVSGPGGPKDDLVAPVALSNKEYVLPVEMISHFGGGDYNQGIAGLESLRRQLMKK
jgi:hypothetical protein